MSTSDQRTRLGSKKAKSPGMDGVSKAAIGNARLGLIRGARLPWRQPPFAAIGMPGNIHGGSGMAVLAWAWARVQRSCRSVK
ncbi:hypothetical protein GCM10009422_15730 [Brevundimonas kwangchunensis]|uniref:Uncharacterized protein n=1 Tax=Brevundimonas kwangchunensis TaxID=322163 RepID=A0ABP3RYJ8_9CAUL